MAVKILYFVHGTTTDNASKLCSGWKEAMLNDLGREQALNFITKYPPPRWWKQS